REFSYVQKLFLTVFSSPRRTLRRLNQINSKLNSTKVIELVYDTPARAVIRWHWLDGIVSSKDICLFNQGIYSAIPTMWGLPRARVQEESCAFNGGSYCEVILDWGRNIRKSRGVISQFFKRRSSL